MTRSLLLVAIAVLLVALVSTASAQPYYTYINTTEVYSASTDGSSNNGFFFDLPRNVLSSGFTIQASTNYTGKNTGAFQVRFVLRRWAPAGIDYDSATSACEASNAVNASLNPNDCYYTDLVPQSNGLAMLPNVSVSLPRAGRYYLSVFTPPGAVQKNTIVGYSVKIQSTQCPDGLGGTKCDTPVMGLTWDGPQILGPNGTVAANEWAYFSFLLTDITTSELTVKFLAPLPTEQPSNSTGFYWRYGNIPFFNPVTADVFLFTLDTTSNWINPWVGNYVFGFYGGAQGLDYSFVIEKNICPTASAGAWCEVARRPYSDPSCLTTEIQECASDFILIGETNVPYNLEVPSETWAYAVYNLANSQYAVTVVTNASADGASTVVLSPDAIPENNAETTALFPLTSVYPVVGSSSVKNSFFTYNYALSGTQLVIGVLGGAKDSNITISITPEACPLNCNGSPNACDPVANRCYCAPSSKKIDANTCAPAEGNEGLSTGAIVAISILVPLGVLVLLGGALFALWWFKFRQQAYDTI